MDIFVYTQILLSTDIYVYMNMYMYIHTLSGKRACPADDESVMALSRSLGRMRRAYMHVMYIYICVCVCVCVCVPAGRGQCWRYSWCMFTVVWSQPSRSAELDSGGGLVVRLLR